jgi:hypothetical protein
MRTELGQLLELEADVDRVVLYYAGHAFSLGPLGNHIGFLAPVNTPTPTADLAALLGAAIDMGTVEITARRLRARHALFVFDATLESTLFRSDAR